MQRLPQQHQDYFYIPASLKAPLATFDTIDLGDEDVLLVTNPPVQPSRPFQTSGEDKRGPQPTNLITKIGGAQSKGRGPASKPGSDPRCQDPSQQDNSAEETSGQQPAEDNENPEDDAPTPTNQSPTHGVEEVPAQCQSAPAAPEGIELEASGESSSDPVGKEVECGEDEPSAQPPPPPARIGKIQGTWLRHQDSDSSSSSGSGCDTFTFRPIKGSASASATQDDDDDDDDTDYTPQTRRRLILREKSHDYSLNLYPEDLDPAQISSPSKRKAYEKRLQRLQVKTSPIVRPRSTTPINVVTLDEYILNSPDRSPASPFQEKLKISLPNSEFSSKPKSPRSARKPSEPREDSCFVFNEEILFSHTRSALVVDEVGHVPLSPRRVLIPPTLSPSSSPKLSRAAGRNSNDTSTQLIYFKGETENEVFGQPAEQENNDSWATFPDSGQSDEVEGKAGEEHQAALSSDSEEEVEADEILTVNIQSAEPSKPANIQVILSAASSSTPSPSTPDSDEAIKAAASGSETVLPQTGDVKGDEVAEPTSCPPPIPPRRRPPPPPPPPPDVIPGDDSSELMAAKCDLLVDIDSH